jgi:ABC-type amino acid transport substrate-binding protein
MSVATVIPGVLCVGSALPDPPFELMDGDTARCFDLELMQAIAAELGLQWRLVPYGGGDLNGIFTGLANETYDRVASADTAGTGHRWRLIDDQPWRRLYVEFMSPPPRSG